LGWVCKLIGGFKGEGKGVISTPQLAPQQVPGEAIWHLYNARKSFSTRGSARDRAWGAYSTPPDPLAGEEGADCPSS